MWDGGDREGGGSMRRKLFTLAAAVSAVLFAAALALWVRSFVLQKAEWAARNSARTAVEVRSAGGNSSRPSRRHF